MTKTIYVTIAEFEEHGGVLEEGRQIFNIAHQAFYHVNSELEDDYNIYVKNGDRGGTVSKTTATVAIQCTPIYK